MKDADVQPMIEVIRKALTDAGFPEAGKGIVQPSFRISPTPDTKGRLQITATYPPSQSLKPEAITQLHYGYGRTLLGVFCSIMSEDAANVFVRVSRWGDIRAAFVTVIVPDPATIQRLRRAVGLA